MTKYRRLPYCKITLQHGLIARRKVIAPARAPEPCHVATVADAKMPEVISHWQLDTGTVLKVSRLRGLHASGKR
jgi:hypothetical protein